MFQRTSEYDAWVNMRQRCLNPRHKWYHRYGGRGITICKRWSAYRNFLEDMGARPSPKHSIDRIDNNRGYTPDNCRWATQREQNFNMGTRKDNTSGHAGVCKSPKSSRLHWRAYTWIGGKQKHIGYFETREQAIEARQTFIRQLGFRWWFWRGWVNEGCQS